ncbi:hypothetical protein Vafri_13992, partial [Volvox africanus]
MDEFYCRACYKEGDLIACDACGACYHRRCVEAHCCGPTAAESNPQRILYQLPPQLLGHGVSGNRSSAAAALVPNGVTPPGTASSSNSDFTRPCLAIASEGFREAVLTSEEECPGLAADWFCPACRCVRCGRACCPIAVQNGAIRPATQNGCEGAPGLHRHPGNLAVAAIAASRCFPIPATGQRRGDAAQLAMWRVMGTRAIAQKVATGADAVGRGAAIAAAAAAAPPLLVDQCRALAASAQSPFELEHRLDTEVAPNPNRTPALNWPLQALLEALLPNEPWKGRRVALQLLAAALFKTMHNDERQPLKRQQLTEKGHSGWPTEPMLKRRRMADGNEGAVAATVTATVATTPAAT